MKKIFTLLFSALSLCSFAGTQVIYDVETVMGDWTTIDENTLTPSLFSGVEAGNTIVITASASEGGQIWLAKLEGDSWSEVNLLDGADITTSVSYTLTENDVTVIAERGIRLKGKNFTLASIAISKGTTAIELSPTKQVIRENGIIYNLAGQKVSESYKGAIIKNGRKYIKD